MSAVVPISATIQRPPLTVYLAAPRGFCAGVDRAIQIVELALAKYGAPVYVRHEIVHNRFVVDSLKAKGAVFVEEFDDIPETDQPVIFSAHGVAKAVPAAAKARNMFVLDATCPLVFKVHIEAARHHEEGLQILLIGHAGHPEVVGTMGQLPLGAVTLIETAADAYAFEPARCPQARLRHADDAVGGRHGRDRRRAAQRFPKIVGPAQGGHLLRHDQSPGGRQSHRAARSAACSSSAARRAPTRCASSRSPSAPAARRRRLIEGARDIPLGEIEGIDSVGVTAGASAPEELVEEVIDAFRARFDVTFETVTTALETHRLQRSARVASCHAASLTPPDKPTAMAVYTEVSDEELASFIASYGLGELLSFKGIAEGVENTNYIVHTTRGHVHSHPLRKARRAGDLPFFLGLMEHLAEHGVTCPTPVRDAEGRNLQPAVGPPGGARHVSRRLWVRRPTAAHCAAVGRALAKLHLGGDGFALQPRQRTRALRVAPPLRALRRHAPARSRLTLRLSSRTS